MNFMLKEQYCFGHSNIHVSLVKHVSVYCMENIILQVCKRRHRKKLMLLLVRSSVGLLCIIVNC